MLTGRIVTSAALLAELDRPVRNLDGSDCASAVGSPGHGPSTRGTRSRARTRTTAVRPKRCGNGGQQWDEWADLFTEDAVYYRAPLRHVRGPRGDPHVDPTTMDEFPNNEMTEFPADWWVIDEEKGWVVAAVWNRMQDLGDGEVHQAINWSLLDYAGNNQWSYEEDIYNVEEFAVMVKAYLAARKTSGR